jgi:hypothetical protein
MVRPRAAARRPRSAVRLCAASGSSDNPDMSKHLRPFAPPVRACARLVRLAAPIAVALALSACAGLEFQWANTGSAAVLERRMIDLYDPMSPVNAWNVF